MRLIRITNGSPNHLLQVMTRAICFSKMRRMWKVKSDLLGEFNMESLLDHDAWYTFRTLMLYILGRFTVLSSTKHLDASVPVQRQAQTLTALQQKPTIEQTLRLSSTWKVSRSTIYSLAPFLHGLP